MPNGHEMLTNDVQSRIRQQSVNVGNPANAGIGDGDQGALGSTLAHLLEYVLEARAGYGVAIRLGLPACVEAVRTGDTLIRHRGQPWARTVADFNAFRHVPVHRCSSAANLTEGRAGRAG